MTSQFVSDYFHFSRLPTNCKLISKEGKLNYTHKVLLAARSEVLRDIFIDVTEQSETVILLPDYTFDEVQTFLEEILDTENEVNSELGQVLISIKKDRPIYDGKFCTENVKGASTQVETDIPLNLHENTTIDNLENIEGKFIDECNTKFNVVR